jgi:hypothetical protein
MLQLRKLALTIARMLGEHFWEAVLGNFEAIPTKQSEPTIG